MRVRASAASKWPPQTDCAGQTSFIQCYLRTESRHCGRHTDARKKNMLRFNVEIAASIAALSAATMLTVYVLRFCVHSLEKRTRPVPRTLSSRPNSPPPPGRREKSLASRVKSSASSSTSLRHRIPGTVSSADGNGRARARSDGLTWVSTRVRVKLMYTILCCNTARALCKSYHNMSA